MSEKKPSQVYIFYGEDDFSLARKIERWKDEFAKKYSASGVAVLDGSQMSPGEIVSALEQVASPSLFSSRKLVVCKNCFPSKAADEDLGDLILKLIREAGADNFFVFYASKRPDRRLSVIKKIFSSDANIVEFSLPHGPALNSWIRAYAKQLGAEIDAAGTDKLAVYLGRDLFEEKKFGGKVVERKEAFDLWQAHNELLKLANYSRHITGPSVEALVLPKVSENIFALSDNLFGRNRRAALKLIEGLFADQNTDEKSTAIKIVGLLTEQIRSTLLVTLLKQRNLTNQQMADLLGWSSGRVFMVLKQTAAAQPAQLKKMLAQLLNIDISLKSSDVNPKLLIDKFVTQFA